MKLNTYNNEVLSSGISKNKESFLEKTAIICGDTKITYKELGDKIERFSRALINLKVGPDDRVILLLKNSPEFVISFFAIANIRGIAIPLNPQY